MAEEEEKVSQAMNERNKFINMTALVTYVGQGHCWKLDRFLV